MVFIYKRWEAFCSTLSMRNIHSVSALEVLQQKAKQPYLVLKHDVETDVRKSLALASIEQKFGHRGSFYVQAYLLDNKENVRMLKEIQSMGHEVSYHYDVMDSCRGNLPKALAEFSEKCLRFQDCGFTVITVCQHGNPVVERVGYTSNRDFFRSHEAREQFPGMADIMVNFKEAAVTDYIYYSDVGRRFQMIYDPLLNDITPSEDKNIPYLDLNAMLSNGMAGKENCIISTHPHRWTKYAVSNQLRAVAFWVVKTVVRLLIQIPIFKNQISRYYFLAKKI